MSKELIINATTKDRVEDSKKPIIVYNEHFFQDEDFQYKQFGIKGKSVRQVIDNLPGAVTDRYIVVLNNERLFAAFWESTFIKEEDVVSITVVPESADGFKRMETKHWVLLGLGIAFLAVGVPLMAVAGAAVGGAMGALALPALFAGGVLTSLGVAAFAFGIIPLITSPSVDNHKDMGVSTIQASGNRVRLGKSIPVHYGKVKIYPDYGMMPVKNIIHKTYSPNNGEDADYIRPYADDTHAIETLNYFFVIGQGEYDINAIYMGNTQLYDYRDSGFSNDNTYEQDGVSFRIMTPNSPRDVSMFLDTGMVNAYTQPDSNNIPIEPKTFENTARKYTKEISLGSSYLYEVRSVQLNLFFERGLWWWDQNNDKIQSTTYNVVIEGKPLKNNGDEIAGNDHWRELSSKNIDEPMHEEHPMLWKARFDLPTNNADNNPSGYGRWKIRITTDRDNDDNDPKVSVKCTINQIICRIANPIPDYHNLTLMTMNIKADSPLLTGGANTKINVIATRKLRTWNPTTGWSANPVATRSMPWAAADALMNTIYGGSTKEKHMNLLSFYNVDEKLKAPRNDTFNASFDRGMKLYEVLGHITKSCRSVAVFQKNRWRLFRDEKQSQPEMMFSSANIIENSHKVNTALKTEEFEDGFEGTFVNEDAGWIEDTITIDKELNYTNPNTGNPYTTSLFGVTNFKQALRECFYMYKSNLLRIHKHTLKAEAEHSNVSYGSYVLLKPPYKGITSSGDIIDFEFQQTDTDIGNFTLNIEPEFSTDPADTHFIQVNDDEGVPSEPLFVKKHPLYKNKIILLKSHTNTVSTYQITNVRITNNASLDFELVIEDRRNLLPNQNPNITRININIYFEGSKRERTKFAFYKKYSDRKYCIVRKIEPSDYLNGKLEMIQEDDRVHDEPANLF